MKMTVSAAAIAAMCCTMAVTIVAALTGAIALLAACFYKKMEVSAENP